MELLTNLFQHQRKAVEKLQKIKVGALYMEQGTGKTRTALELIKLRFDAGKADKILWLCPCSVKENLRRDLLKHCDDISNIEICGIETLSSSIKTNSRLLKMVQDVNTYLIVDESNLVKNPFAKRTKRIIVLSEHCRYKLILNGTPISRNEADLYAQWYILDYRILGYKSYWSFERNHLEYDDYGKIRRVLNVDYLTKKIAPYTYQVKKSECMDLPEKTYSTKYYWLDDEQEEEYARVKEMFLSVVDEFDESTIYRLFTAMQLVISGRKITSTIKQHISSVSMFNNAAENPRNKALMNIIAGITEKCIIFCKYTQEIKDVIELINKEYGEGTAVPFHGELNQKKRQNNLDIFRDKAQFLVANKTCAGYGLNLQFCSYIIYYSNDWDFATRAQSEDRVHRIGQDKNVHIIDICANNKLDERILDCLLRKERLVDSFKKEIDLVKDKSQMDIWLSGKTAYGKKYTKKCKVEHYEELKEESR